MLEKDPRKRFNINQVGLHSWLEMNKEKIKKRNLFKPKNNFLKPKGLMPTGELQSGVSKNLGHLMSPLDPYKRSSRASRKRLVKETKPGIIKTGFKLMCSPASKNLNPVSPKNKNADILKNIDIKVPLSDAKMDRQNGIQIMLSSLSSIKHSKKKNTKKIEQKEGILVIKGQGNMDQNNEQIGRSLQRRSYIQKPRLGTFLLPSSSQQQFITRLG